MFLLVVDLCILVVTGCKFPDYSSFSDSLWFLSEDILYNSIFFVDTRYFFSAICHTGLDGGVSMSIVTIYQNLI